MRVGLVVVISCDRIPKWGAFEDIVIELEFRFPFDKDCAFNVVDTEKGGKELLMLSCEVDKTLLWGIYAFK